MLCQENRGENCLDGNGKTSLGLGGDDIEEKEKTNQSTNQEFLTEC